MTIASLNSNIWNSIQNFQLPFAEEYLRQKYNWSPVFSRIALEEYKKFIFLSVTSDTPVTPSIDIDEVWHTHILHTRNYGVFCKSLGMVVHHDPGMPSQRADFQDQYRATLDYYEKVFAKEPPASVWPRVTIQGEKNLMEKAYDAFIES